MLEQVLALRDAFLVRAANMGEEAVKTRFRYCPSAFHCVFRRAAGNPELVGYFILLPLNRNACRELRDGTITSGREIQVSGLANTDDVIAGLYLSVVCAVGPRAQSAAIDGVVAALRERYFADGVRDLFVRAATGAGAQMLERLSGTKFEADGRIHVIDMGRYDLITAQRTE